MNPEWVDTVGAVLLSVMVLLLAIIASTASNRK